MYCKIIDMRVQALKFVYSIVLIHITVLRVQLSMFVTVIDHCDRSSLLLLLSNTLYLRREKRICYYLTNYCSVHMQQSMCVKSCVQIHILLYIYKQYARAALQ